MKTAKKHNVSTISAPHRPAQNSYVLSFLFKTISAVLILIFGFSKQSSAQEINFGSYADYQIELHNVTMGDLEFEGPIKRNGGIYEIELSDAYILEILGVKYLDVGVLIEGEGELVHESDPEQTIPLTLKSAYANRGQENISDVQLITLSNNIGDVRFPILARDQAPPGPPPRPPTGEFNQSEVNESAFLYFYGEIDVGDVDAGFYSGTITINVRYDAPPEPNN